MGLFSRAVWNVGATPWRMTKTAGREARYASRSRRSRPRSSQPRERMTPREIALRQVQVEQEKKVMRERIALGLPPVEPASSADPASMILGLIWLVAFPSLWIWLASTPDLSWWLSGLIAFFGSTLVLGKAAETIR